MAQKVNVKVTSPLYLNVTADENPQVFKEGVKEFKMAGSFETTDMRTLAVYRNGSEALSQDLYHITPDRRLILRHPIVSTDDYIEVRSAPSAIFCVFRDVLLFRNEGQFTEDELEGFAPSHLDVLSLDSIEIMKENETLLSWLVDFDKKYAIEHFVQFSVGYVLDYYINERGIYGTIKLEEG